MSFKKQLEIIFNGKNMKINVNIISVYFVQFLLCFFVLHHCPVLMFFKVRILVSIVFLQIINI